MGLDITAYSHLKPVGKHTEGWCEDENHVNAFAYLPFTASFRGIPVTDTDDQFINGGCFEVTDSTVTHDFQAGSYGGYNRWREDLSKQFNPSAVPFAPFYELIYFADNEGTISPDAARDLLADFTEHADRYAPPGDDEFAGYYREKYQDWTRACELAADGGLIQFH